MPHTQGGITLPSINEMFPDYMMESWYADSPLHHPHRNYSRLAQHTGHSPLILSVAHHEHIDNPRRRHTPTHYPEEQIRLGQPRHLQGAYHNDRIPDGVSYWTSRSLHLSSYSANQQLPSPVSTTTGSSSPESASYSFNVLRPHPLTANLENVASSTNVAAQPRIPHTSGQAYPASPTKTEASVTSIQKARPTFRVQLPPASPTMTPAPVSALALANHAVERDESAHDHAYPANAYLSAPITGSAQNMQRISHAQTAAGQNIEEKKHCCPHCQKRFNRPSSLNIHVNTHTGAKPFQCPFPGCQRRFNVNSNMRRHWRNHLNSTRRRDAVARLVDPHAGVLPTPSLSTSSGNSPRSQYPRSVASDISSEAYPSRSPSPDSPYLSESEIEEDNARMNNKKRPTLNTVTRPQFARASPSGQGHMDKEGGASATRKEGIAVFEGYRKRSRSSPVPQVDRALAYAGYTPTSTRNRSMSCTTGCPCQPISTTLRPAFPSSVMSSSTTGPSQNPRSC